jgi:hypothetical protein
MKRLRCGALAIAALCATIGATTISAAQAPTAPTPSAGLQADEPTAPALNDEQLARIAAVQDRDLAAGIVQVREFAEEGDLFAARVLADVLIAPRGVASWRLAWWNEGGAFVRGLLDATSSWTEPLGWNGRPAAERARVSLERGLVSLAPQERAMAELDFGRALALAPAGELRTHASYDLALLPLLEGEDWRARIPELGGTPPQPVPGAAPVPEEEQPDPLEMARGAYLEARARFIERLKLDWRDADTRANVELIQRRLRELDELEQQREEQQQEQEQQQDGEENQDQEQNSDQQDQQEPEDGEQEPQDGEDGEEQEQPDEHPEGDESEQDSEGQENEPQDAEPQEVHLSQEELQRLLNRLAEHEKEAEALRELRHQRGSKGVDKDW